MNPKAYIWTEKYRPKKVSDIVGDFKNDINNYIKEEKTIPNFLFYSKSPGTGKSSVAKAIANEVGCDILILNSSDDRKIESVRNNVKKYVMTKSTNGKRRCVFLDEFDGMTRISQEALRNIMETYSHNAFFILTCNSINRVHEAIQSRCKKIAFAYPDKLEIAEYLKTICEEEQLEYELDALDLLIEKNYPNIRNCVIALQDLKINNKPLKKENVSIVDTMFEDLWAMIEEKKLQDLIKEIMENKYDERELNTYIWRKAVELNNVKLIQLTSKNEDCMARGSDPKIIFISSLYDMIK